jgi:hypothetical protein
MNLLGLHGQRLATRRHHPHRRTTHRQPADDRRRVRQVLAVIHHQQEVLGAQEARERVGGRLTGERDNGERADGRVFTCGATSAASGVIRELRCVENDLARRRCRRGGRLEMRS